jgi:hypothetical protein
MRPWKEMISMSLTNSSVFADSKIQTPKIVHLVAVLSKMQ